MNAYADTSFLISYFGQDGNTLVAHRYASAWTRPPRLAWTPFGRLEFNNATRALVFSGRLSSDGLLAIQRRVREDLAGGVLAAAALDARLHYEAAEKISAAYTATNGARTLDVLHIAAARVLGATDFLGFDRRQRELAARCGFRVLP